MSKSPKTSGASNRPSPMRPELEATHEPARGPEEAGPARVHEPPACDWGAPHGGPCVPEQRRESPPLPPGIVELEPLSREERIKAAHGLAMELHALRKVAEAATELLGWSWESPESLDWTEVRVDIRNLQQALDAVPRTAKATNGGGT